MPPQKPQIPDFSEIAKLFAEGLYRKAESPGIETYVPHNSQLLFHTSQALEKLYIGGNRSGKTVGGIAEDIFWLTGKHPYRKDLPEPPIKGRLVAVDIEDGIKKIALPEVLRWIPTSFLKNGSFEDSYDKQSKTLTLTNGSFLEFMSYEQDVEKFAGTSRHFVHFDEEPPKEIFDECIMRLVDTNGSYWISMTPLIEFSWVKEVIYEPWLKGNKSIFVLEVNTSENPHVATEAVERITRNLSEEERLARTQGKFINHTGLVYGKYFDQEESIVEDLLPKLYEYRNPTKFEFFTCMDHGWRNPAVFLFCVYDLDGNVTVFDEIYETSKSVREMSELYLKRLETLRISPLYCVGDPTIRNTNAITTTSVQTEYAEHGVSISLGNNNMRAGLARMQNRFAKRQIKISRRCEKTLWEIENYRWDKFANKKLEARKNKKEVPLARNDHAMDALRYGILSRPSLDGEDEIERTNILGGATVGPIEFDYEKVFSTPEKKFSHGELIDW